MKQQPRKPRLFTGRHMWFVMLGFFGTIIVVNLIMARFAIGTFGGTVVDNSYVASQSYNDWLAQAREQDQLGWTVDALRGSDDHIDVAVNDDEGAPLADAKVSALARHPLGRSNPVDLAFEHGVGKGYRSLDVLPAGRWTLHLTIEQGGRTFAAVRDVR